MRHLRNLWEATPSLSDIQATLSRSASSLWNTKLPLGSVVFSPSNIPTNLRKSGLFLVVIASYLVDVTAKHPEVLHFACQGICNGLGFKAYKHIDPSLPKPSNALLPIGRCDCILTPEANSFGFNVKGSLFCVTRFFDDTRDGARSEVCIPKEEAFPSLSQN